MSKFDELDQLLKNGNGYLLTADVVESGISKPTLARYVKQKNLERVAHGIYIRRYVSGSVLSTVSAFQKDRFLL